MRFWEHCIDPPGLGSASFFWRCSFCFQLGFSRLGNGLADPRNRRRRRYIFVSAVPFGPGKEIWRSCRFVGSMFRVLGLIRLDFILAMLVKKASSMASSIAATIGSSSINHVRTCGRSVCECSWLQKRQCVRTRSSCSLSLMSGFASCRPSSLFGKPTLVVWVTGVSFC